VKEYAVEPGEYGLKRGVAWKHARRQYRESALIVRRFWTATKVRPGEVVLLNGAAALYVSGRAATIMTDLLAAANPHACKARRKLAALVE